MATTTTHTSAECESTKETRGAIQRMHLSFVGDVDNPTFRYSAQVSANHAGVTGKVLKAMHGFADVCIQGTADQIRYYKKSIMRRARNHGLLCNLAGSEEIAPVDNETGFCCKLDLEY